MTALRPKAPPLAYAVKDAAEAVGISASKLEERIKLSELRVKWIDNKRVIRTPELEAWLEAQPDDKPGVLS